LAAGAARHADSAPTVLLVRFTARGKLPIVIADAVPVPVVVVDEATPETCGRRAVVQGGARLHGAVSAGGAKNAATKMMASALLTTEPITLDNVPTIEAIRTQAALLQGLGASVTWDRDEHRVTVHAEHLTTDRLEGALASRERASFVMTGPLLARLGHVEAPRPGGCNLGERPVNVDIRGFQAMGATVEQGDGVFRIRASRLRGAGIYLDYPSHTGTENLMMAACLAEGTTTIRNASCEPEVVALADHLNRMGARVRGAGTPRIEIHGVSKLRGAHTRVIPDRMEAGSFAIAAVATGGDVEIVDIVPEDLDPVLYKLAECGATVDVMADRVRITAGTRLQAVEVQAIHYPGFPTDLQTPFGALLTQVNGQSIIHERVFESRFRYVDELRTLGARIETNGGAGPRETELATKAYIYGPTQLVGAKVRALDLRCGLALIIAGMCASGETEIIDFHHAERGYEDLAGRLASLGAFLRIDGV
jgi:UDP-N-acetylglucosamine 1-carboxyvinyltransferase